MSNLRFYDLGKSVPENAKKPINGGRLKGKTDINPMWRIKRLTEMFGPCGIGWYYNVTKQWTEEHGEEVACFVNLELFVCEGGVWSKPIFGNGGNMFAQTEKGGIYVSDECFKMATTDALSVACKQLGIGADVYWESDRTKYGDKPASDKDTTANAEKFKPVYEELARIGYTEESIRKTYKVSGITEMSDLQIKDFLAKAKNVKSKERE